MKARCLSFAIVILLTWQWTPALAAPPKSPPSYEESRKAAWMLSSKLIEVLEQGDAKQFPGTHAWLKDLREQTKGISEDTPVSKWPKVDVGALLDHNPNFWRMYFEIAPGDPTLTVIHAGLLLSQGEAMRAVYILELGQHRPGIPKEIRQAFRSLQATAIGSLKTSNDLTKEGTELFDQGDYDGAMKKYREALDGCPQNGWTYYELGYTLRTKAAVARGEPLDKPGTVKTKGKSHDTPDITAAFADARRHDPLQFIAYQGTDREVINACVAIVTHVKPAWQALRKEGITKDAEFHALKDLSEGLSEAGIHDLAIFCRQLMAARRNSYAPEDYPIFEAGLRKLAPGDKTEAVLVRLAGKNQKLLTFRSLTKQEPEDGQPALGSGEHVYMPENPAPKEDSNKPVSVDHLRLLTNENDIAKRTTVEDLVKFTKAVEKLADEIFGKCEKPCKILMQFTCTPTGHTLKIMHQPKEIDEKPLKEMYKAVEKLDKLAVKEDKVEFQIQFTIKPKGQVPKGEK